MRSMHQQRNKANPEQDDVASEVSEGELLIKRLYDKARETEVPATCVHAFSKR